MSQGDEKRVRLTDDSHGVRRYLAACLAIVHAQQEEQFDRRFGDEQAKLIELERILSGIASDIDAELSTDEDSVGAAPHEDTDWIMLIDAINLVETVHQLQNNLIGAFRGIHGVTRGERRALYALACSSIEIVDAKYMQNPGSIARVAHLRAQYREARDKRQAERKQEEERRAAEWVDEQRAKEEIQPISHCAMRQIDKSARSYSTWHGPGCMCLVCIARDAIRSAK